MSDDSWLLLFFIVIVGGTVCTCILVVHNSPEYQQGYDEGYNEFNITRFNAVEDVTSIYINPFNSNHMYYKGYIDGYEDRKWDNTEQIAGTAK